MSPLFAMIAVMAAAASSAADEMDSFKITTKREDDRVEVKQEKDKAIFLVHSPFGISSAVIKRIDETWPQTIIIKLHLSGLESFSLSNGKTAIQAAVSSQNGSVRIWKDGNENMPLNSESSFWMPIRMIDSDGKQTSEIPLEGGYFEIELPKKYFEANPESITLNWVDFYRN